MYSCRGSDIHRTPEPNVPTQASDVPTMTLWGLSFPASDINHARAAFQAFVEGQGPSPTTPSGNLASGNFSGTNTADQAQQPSSQQRSSPEHANTQRNEAELAALRRRVNELEQELNRQRSRNSHLHADDAQNRTGQPLRESRSHSNLGGGRTRHDRVCTCPRYVKVREYLLAPSISSAD